MLTYEFFLPEKERADYLKAIDGVTDSDLKGVDTVWKIIKDDFIRLFNYKIWGKKFENQTIAILNHCKNLIFNFLVRFAMLKEIC